MVRGLYTAYTGMANEQKRLDIISNNIANAATVGYKEESVTNQSFDEMLTLKIRDGSEGHLTKKIGDMSLGVKLGEVYTDYGQGSLRTTGNTYDLAIEGKGFFAVGYTNKVGDESVRYTRNGSFKITRDGHIVDTEGNSLQSENGDAQVPVDAASVVIDVDGTVYADGTAVDKIMVVDFTDYDYLEKVGDVSYRAIEGAEMIQAEGLIHQGFTEQSNVNAVSEMVEMITITRAYEANQKVIQTTDTMLDKAANSVGRVG
ncbi:flagellar hook-basal body protein [Acetivibrio ethanolgignens]|uniref:Flagellar basal body and hook protein n=1 Tax=Acetivibrio ethanolgignens TaxID=290052 RepID=A0A0V8QIE3_9FIRM|nr:flagellar hook-basal body protein [Acetivibrio ethanolgignens]KSV60324.1 flagellar basal body and hook protein [Acetivibrio ethanolgignens]